MAKKTEDGFEKLARIIKEEGEDIRREVREEIRGEIQGLERRMDVRFTGIERRLDTIVQPQLDEHAHRIKTIEFKTAHLPDPSRAR